MDSKYVYEILYLQMDVKKLSLIVMANLITLILTLQKSKSKLQQIYILGRKKKQ